MDRQPWEAFADGLLQREALLCRIGRGVPPRDFPGMFVDHGEVDRILSQLPGLDGPPMEAAAPLLETLEPRLAELREQFHLSLADGSTFSRVCRTAGLDRQQAEVLAVVAAVELEPCRQRLAVYLQDSINLPRLTLATLRRIFAPPHPAAACVSGGAALVRAGLVAIDATGPWATRMVSLSPRLAWALAGDSSLDPALPAGAKVVRPAGIDAAGLPLILVVGDDRVSRTRTAFRRCEGSAFLVTPVPESVEGWDATVREATVAGLGVVVHLERDLPALGRARIEAASHLAWALCSSVELPLESLPDRPWTEVRPDAAIETLGAHRLSPEQLELVVRAAAGRAGDVGAAVRRLASGHLDGLARRIQPRRSWDELVLPADEKAQLRELTARYRHRSTVYAAWGFPDVPSAGLVALFSGQSGTGKTLAAEVVAADLGLDAYKVDLSSVVSKYIGETEKNLERIFTAASAGNVVLFFDEADALFGKRSEVSDAHDRYANIEVAYLLQRVEAYDGIVILATNLARNLDPAFLRRISVAIEFPMPDDDQRRAIWELSFPPSAPTTELDLDFLARQFRISGGAIRNAALSAGFLAAEAGGPITMDVVVLALKREFQKLGRLRTEVEFDRYFHLVRADGETAATNGR